MKQETDIELEEKYGKLVPDAKDLAEASEARSRKSRQQSLEDKKKQVKALQEQIAADESKLESRRVFTYGRNILKVRREAVKAGDNKTLDAIDGLLLKAVDDMTKYERMLLREDGCAI